MSAGLPESAATASAKADVGRGARSRAIHCQIRSSERRAIRPADVGERAIGHHGFFAERHRDSLWRETLDWIDARCA